MTDRFGLLYDAGFERDLVQSRREPDFFEVIPDRLMVADVPDDVRERLTNTPTVFHCLDLSLGSDEAVCEAYLGKLADLATQFTPMWISDHLAFTHIDGVHAGHLSPIRWDSGSIDRIAGKIAAIQDRLQLPFLVENIAYYFRIPGADLTEAALMRRLVERTGCGMLLDVNNVAVNAANHGFDPLACLEEFPLDAVGEIHVAGHRMRGETTIDSHGEPVDDGVWDLLRFVAGELESVNVVLERDQDVPPLGELMRELAIARRCVEEGRGGRVPAPRPWGTESERDAT